MDLFETQTLASITANLIQTTAKAIAPTVAETEPTTSLRTTTTASTIANVEFPSSGLVPSYKVDDGYGHQSAVSDVQELQAVSFRNLSNTLEVKY